MKSKKINKMFAVYTEWVGRRNHHTIRYVVAENGKILLIDAVGYFLIADREKTAYIDPSAVNHSIVADDVLWVDWGWVTPSFVKSFFNHLYPLREGCSFEVNVEPFTEPSELPDDEGFWPARPGLEFWETVPPLDIEIIKPETLVSKVFNSECRSPLNFDVALPQ